jgi:hypothetical protein
LLSAHLRDIWRETTDERRFYEESCRTSGDDLTGKTTNRAEHAPSMLPSDEIK